MNPYSTKDRFLSDDENVTLDINQKNILVVLLEESITRRKTTVKQLVAEAAEMDQESHEVSIHRQLIGHVLKNIAEEGILLDTFYPSQSGAKAVDFKLVVSDGQLAELQTMINAAHNPALIDTPIGGMVTQLWADGEITLTKGGDLFGQRNLHPRQPGITGLSVEGLVWPRKEHGGNIVTEDAGKIRQKMIELLIAQL